MTRAPVVIVRTDASHRIGHGHVMRCLTLGAALQERGAQVTFVCREAPGDLCADIETRGFSVTRLPRAVEVSEADAWLGATWEVDAEQTMAATAAFSRIDWLIVDQYAIDQRWEARLRTRVQRILAVDDLADRRHDCDLLLDQNLVEGFEARYGGLVPPKCGLMLGPAYALTQQEYVKSRDTIRVRSGPVKNIVIFFGGADARDLAGFALDIFLRLDHPEIAAHVVMPSGSPFLELVRARAASHPNVVISTGLPSLAPLYVQADLAIGAAGSSSWERLCLGLPALVITLAENQVAIAQALHARGLVRWLGTQEQVSAEDLDSALRQIVREGLDPAWSRHCTAVVDGRGALRVRSAMLAAADMPMIARPVRADDESLLLEWANDPKTRAQAFSPGRIDPASHHAWFAGRLADPLQFRLFIVETADAIPVGQVRFERRNDAWRIDYSVAQPFRGRGIGRNVLSAALEALRRVDPSGEAEGEVLRSNPASMKVFRALEFQERDAGNHVVFRREV